MSHWWHSMALLLVMLCATKALYTLHQEPESFDGALNACLTDGFLSSMGSKKDNEHILSSVSTSLKSAGSFNFWVGMRKPAGTCNQEDLPLHGFVWTSNNSSDSEVSQWRRKPVGTCTSDRCGLLSLDFDGEQVKNWGWADSSCTRTHGFICTRKRSGTSPPDISDHGSPCTPGHTPCGAQRPSRPPQVRTSLPSPWRSLSHTPEDERTPTPSPAASLTSSSNVISLIRENTADKYSIFIPVLVALLVLVVLVVMFLAVFKCCFKKRTKKEATHSKNGGKAVTVDLTDTDLQQDETTA